MCRVWRHYYSHRRRLLGVDLLEDGRGGQYSTALPSDLAFTGMLDDRSWRCSTGVASDSPDGGVLDDRSGGFITSLFPNSFNG